MTETGEGWTPKDVAEWQRHEAERAHDEHYDARKKMVDAALVSGTVALRTGILVNGGAAVAVLAFIGGLVGQGKVSIDQIDPVARTLMWFAFGVAGAAAGLAFVYFVNYFAGESLSNRRLTWEHPYSEHTGRSKWFWRVSMTFQVCAVVVGIGALVCFVIGMFEVRDAILGLEVPP